jgi:hypothetical protein
MPMPKPAIKACLTAAALFTLSKGEIFISIRWPLCTKRQFSPPGKFVSRMQAWFASSSIEAGQPYASR